MVAASPSGRKSRSAQSPRSPVAKLKHFRRIATRFDKLARNFLAAVLLASTRLWLRAYESTT